MTFEQEMKILYRDSLEKGREQGREQGLEEGRAEGREQGLEQGRAEGREQGRAEGADSKNRELAKAFRDRGIAIEIIVESTGLSPEEIKAL